MVARVKDARSMIPSRPAMVVEKEVKVEVKVEGLKGGNHLLSMAKTPSGINLSRFAMSSWILECELRQIDSPVCDSDRVNCIKPGVNA